MTYPKLLPLIGGLFILFAAITTFPALAEFTHPLVLPGIKAVNVISVFEESFDAPTAWETYSSPSGVALGVENGIYREYTANPGYVWGLNAVEHTDVIVEVEVTPLTVFSDIGAGVMCRADESNNGNGYYFVINVNGYYSIRVGQGDEIAPLVDWQPSPAVRTGIDRNLIRAVCINQQLAMYVNDTLVASIEDDTYHTGYTGLTAAAGDFGVDIAFDNLTLYTARFIDGS